MRSIIGSAVKADALIRTIADMLDTMPVLGRPGPWALLDWPSHGNVGDSAIWAGTLAVLKPRFGRPPSFVSRCGDYPSGLDRAMPEGPILLHGGGNFGDIWRGYHENRMRLLTELRHRSIVQLPQSIHYHDPAALAEMARAIGCHPDFTLMVRDKQSLQIARDHFDCKIVLCPDLAFGLGRVESRVCPKVDVFSLLRDDVERANHGVDYATAREFGPVDDWARRPSARTQPDRRLLKVLHRMPHAWAIPRIEAAYARLASREVQRGADMLAEGRVVLTDRLHAHVLCVLMQKPHVVLDNSYGKIGAFIDTWPSDGLTHKPGDNLERLLAMMSADLKDQEMR